MMKKYHHNYFLDNSLSALFRPDLAESYFNISPYPHFCSHKKQFSALTAWWLAELSRWIYKDINSLEYYLQKNLVNTNLSLQNISCYQNIKIGLLKYKSAYTKKSLIIIVLSGSQGLLHWYYNSLSWQYDLRKHSAKIHHGFWRLASQISQHILLLLKDIAKDSDILISGHSLGGALAKIVNNDVLNLYKTTVYTFGSPRIGNIPYYEQLTADDIYDVINYKDIITKIPYITHNRFNYNSANELIYINSAGSLIRNPSKQMISNDQSKPYRYKRLRQKPYLLPENCIDHAPINYVTYLAEHACHELNQKYNIK